MTTDLDQLEEAVVEIEDLPEIGTFFDDLMKDDLLGNYNVHYLEQIINIYLIPYKSSICIFVS